VVSRRNVGWEAVSRKTLVVMFRFHNVDGQIFRVAELAHIGGGEKRSTRRGRRR
jgi:hypothetical protein